MRVWHERWALLWACPSESASSSGCALETSGSPLCMVEPAPSLRRAPARPLGLSRAPRERGHERPLPVTVNEESGSRKVTGRRRGCVCSSVWCECCASQVSKQPRAGNWQVDPVRADVVSKTGDYIESSCSYLGECHRTIQRANCERASVRVGKSRSSTEGGVAPSLARCSDPSAAGNVRAQAGGTSSNSFHRATAAQPKTPEQRGRGQGPRRPGIHHLF